MSATEIEVATSMRHFPHPVSFGGSVTFSQSSIGSSAIDASNPIVASKLYHRHAAFYSQATGSSVAAATETLFIATADCVVNSVRVFVDTAPIGVKTFTVDVKKSTAGGAFSSILSSVVTIDSGDTNRSVSVGTLSGTPTLIATDVLQVVVAVAGASGTQALGMGVRVEIDEEPV